MALGACQTPYQAEGIGGGYEDIRLSDDLFEIRARGNGYSSAAHTRNIMLLRAADLALQNNFSHFAILDGSMRESTRFAGMSTGMATTNVQATVYGNTAYGTATTVYTPSSPQYVSNQHGAMMVKMLHSPSQGALDARMIYDQLNPKIGKR
ncbi:hypothetical protein QEZ48_19735 [Aquamicrobium lusatiense]|nr:hypothetical protein [Aquamicrobium lusatiense]MDH4993050.1 hypothetical protein [Aquamicrobium lusatiense]